MPIKPESGPTPAMGPKIGVFRLYSEIGLAPTDPASTYWNALQEADVTEAIGEFSWINANLSEARATDQQFHRDMMAHFFAPDLLPQIINRELEGATSVVFNRIGNLLQSDICCSLAGSARKAGTLTELDC